MKEEKGISVPYGWQTTFAALVDFAGIILLLSFYWALHTTGCLSPSLLGVADALPGMAMAM
jgi:hypothetical protein